jgi:hypothetical protein
VNFAIFQIYAKLETFPKRNFGFNNCHEMFYTFIVALIKSSICTFQLKYTQYPNYNIDRFNLFRYRNIRVFACISDNKEESEWTIASIVEIHYAREDKHSINKQGWIARKNELGWLSSAHLLNCSLNKQFMQIVNAKSHF